MTDKEITFEQIPETVKTMYKITKNEDEIHISHPNYIGMDNVHIRESPITITISNDHACITLWKDIEITHTTVYAWGGEDEKNTN